MVKKIIAVWGVATLLLIITASSGSASDRKGTYDTDHGYQWWARYTDNAIAWVSSTNCNQGEIDGMNNAKSSSANTDEFATRWPSGVRFSRYKCDGTVNRMVDIHIEYQPPDRWNRDHKSTIGGHNLSIGSKRDSGWCKLWNAPEPCGYKISYIHINKDKYDSRSLAYQSRLFMHETGHSLGLAHHCASNSIMNDGWSRCNGGAFLNITGYQVTDRNGFVNTYPNWKYPSLNDFPQ